MKKRIKYIVFLGVMLLGVISCNQDEFLETTNKTNLTDATMWASESNADIFLNECYHDLPSRNTPNELDDFTDNNDGGWYYNSRNWRAGIVTASTTNFGVWFTVGGPTDEADWFRSEGNGNCCWACVR